MSVRVRYAPSPTGMQHIGGVRTALFNYLFARSLNGSFILRIEDTDQTRFDPKALQDIYDTFDWLGIREDEGPRFGGHFGPYIQSLRFDIYKSEAERLVHEGRAYRCFCTSERLEALREEQTKAKSQQIGYDRTCRNLTDQQIQEKLQHNLPYVIRLKIPLDGTTVFQDQILGPIERNNKDINPDPVILKTDGFPTYHLANVIDDHLMKITHVLRAQEWVPSTPIHILLYQAFGWEPPSFLHLPMVMGSDGQKLSKRHGSTSLQEFKKAGYLPEALINYISQIGWSFDDSKEFFTLKELEACFDSTKLQKSPGVFDYKKLQWFNGHYIRQTSNDVLLTKIIPYLVEKGFTTLDDPTHPDYNILIQSVDLVKERITLLQDASDALGFLFEQTLTYDPSLLVPKGLSVEETKEVLEQLMEISDTLFQGSVDDAHHIFEQLAERLGKKLGQIMMPMRIAVTGTKASPPLIESMRLLSPNLIKERLSKAIKEIDLVN
jgi:glutamyl-tRNA synthetase